MGSVDAASQFRTDTEMPSHDAIPDLYRTLAGMNSSDEKAALVGMVPSVRAALWQYHLEQVLSSDVPLSAEQRVILEDGIALLAGGAGLFSAESDEPATERSLLTRTSPRSSAPS
jgi:hypothetical protein